MVFKAIAVVWRRPERAAGEAAASVRRAAEAVARGCGCTLNIPVPVATPTPEPGAFTALVELYADSEDGVVAGAEAFVRALADDTAKEPLTAAAYLATERRPVRYDRTWPDGEPSPGMRMLSLCRRRAGTTRAEFEAYWAGPHTEVACSFTVPIWNYTQSMVARPLTPDAPELDGVAGLHFRSYADWVARYVGHPEEAARGAADGARFMDLGAAETLFAVETVLATGRPAAVADAAAVADTDTDTDSLKFAARPPVVSGNQPTGKARS
ncbi:EthD domain-containing protein [Yinghuangia sp. YIM S09857]|uniref:EthD domain-containing protein n=1 Tax=Yinghuangia sp. YIM S09857 TaxID=3436929 RepID=UPI003F539C42